MGYRLRVGASIVALASGAVATTAPSAAEELTLYCSPQIEWCQIMVEEFQKATGIEVAMTRKSSGETFAQVKAEAQNPRGDVWWGGTGDPHLQAAEEGLTEAYQSPILEQLNDWAVAQAEAADYGTVGIYAGALGIGYNKEVLEEKGLPAPACWKDLADPAYRGEIQIANPNSSGTAYTTLATLVQIFGEDEAFELLKAMHQNVNQYTQSGSAPIKAAARGETTDRHHLHARHGDREGPGLPDRDRLAVRGHRLRDRLDEHHQGRTQSGEREEMVRLGADRGGAGARRQGAGVPGRPPTPAPRRRRRLPISSRSI